MSCTTRLSSPLQGFLVTSPITGRRELYFPSFFCSPRLAGRGEWHVPRVVRILVSVPVSIALFCVFVGIVWALFRVEAYIKATFAHVPLIGLVPTIIYTLSLPTCNAVCSCVARALTDWENHRTQSEYDAHLVPKLVLYQCVSNYLSLFYCMFVLQDLDRLRSQLSTMFITNFVRFRVLMDSFRPP